MLKASSLLYAIFVCLIVSLLCGSLVLVFNFQYQLKQRYFLEEDILRVSNNHQLQILQKLGTQELQSVGTFQAEEGIFKTQFQVKKWGFYDLLNTTTFFKKDTVHKTVLVGNKSTSDALALYVSDLDKPISIGGETKITGDVKISKYGVKPAYINNQNYTGKHLIYGKIGISKKQLPRLQKIESLKFIEELDEVFYEDLKSANIYNSFQNKTLIVNVSEVNNISDVTISGNIILKSNDSICIKNTVQLNDVVIEAKSVLFENNFNGTVQVFAKKGVYVGKSVQLKYPSSIYIDNDHEELISISLAEGSKLAGGIVLIGASYQSSLNRLITIEKDAVIIGDVYCYGKTQLKGKVMGSVYTDRFYLKTAAAIYENYIVDGEVNREELPVDFIGLPLFVNENSKYEVIKEL